MRNILNTVKAAWPMLSRALKSGQLFHPQCKLVAPDSDVQCDYDVEVPIAAGVILTCNVFRCSVPTPSSNVLVECQSSKGCRAHYSILFAGNSADGGTN